MRLRLASSRDIPYPCRMSVSQLANAVQQLSPQEHAAFLDALLAFDADAIRQRLEDLEDIREAKDVLASETEWTSWEQVKAELHELHGQS